MSIALYVEEMNIPEYYPKILLAEDDRNFGLVLKRELEEEGYAVKLVDDGCEAVRCFIDHGDEYGFVILDIKMPRLDGINALKIIKRFDTNVPAITISGNAGSREMAESKKIGAIECFTKPFEISRIKQIIKKNIARNNNELSE